MQNTGQLSDAEVLSRLVTTALAQDKLSGLSEIIGIIAKSVNAPIAILWQIAPEPVKDTLFMLAEWFAEPQEIPTYFHILPRSDAKISWQAIDTGEVCSKYASDMQDKLFYVKLPIGFTPK